MLLYLNLTLTILVENCDDLIYVCFYLFFMSEELEIQKVNVKIQANLNTEDKQNHWALGSDFSILPFCHLLTP